MTKQRIVKRPPLVICDYARQESKVFAARQARRLREIFPAPATQAKKKCSTNESHGRILGVHNFVPVNRWRENSFKHPHWPRKNKR